jgi:hypothetical protein
MTRLARHWRLISGGHVVEDSRCSSSPSARGFEIRDGVRPPIVADHVNPRGRKRMFSTIILAKDSRHSDLAVSSFVDDARAGYYYVFPSHKISLILVSDSSSHPHQTI